jgi:putative ABC transport system permease protein
MDLSLPSGRRRGFGLLAKVHARLLRQRPEMDIISAILLTAVCCLAGFGLMLSHAIEETFARSGDPNTLVVQARGSKSEAESFISPQASAALRSALSGAGMSSLPLDEQLVISASVERGGTTQFLSLRGIAPTAAVPGRGGRRLIEGRMFRPGVNEVIIGRGVLRMFPSLRVGESIALARKSWLIVGVFEMGGDVRENETVGDLRQVQTRYGAGDLTNSIRIQTEPARMERIRAVIKDDSTLEFMADPESAYFERQAKPMVSSVRRLQLLIMALVIPAALLGLLSIQRIHLTSMLGELRMLSFIGFQGRDIMLSLLLRSLAMGALAAAAASAVLALAVAGRSVELDLGMQSVSLTYTPGPEVYFGIAVVASIITLAAGLLSGVERKLFQ